MEIFYRNQANFTILIILIIICSIALRKLDRKDPINNSFLMTVVGVIIGLFAESLSDIIGVYVGTLPIIINNISSVVLFIIAPIISFNFFFFIFNIIYQGKKLDKLIWFILIVPVISNIIISLLSPFFGLFFNIDSLNIYTRGPLWMLSAFSTYIFMILGVFLVSINYKRMLKHDFWLILIVGIIPILGGIAQSIYFGVLTMWSSAGSALIIVFLFLHNRMIHLDSLTGAWNREAFLNTYSRRIALNADKPFGAIYFDIDNLKLINDTYGHFEGDNAIRLVVKIINDSLDSGFQLCRLGGDEFILLSDCETEAKVNSILEIIKKAFKDHEEIKKIPYNLECSFSAALYTNQYASLNAFLSKLDYLMYEEKFAKRKAKR